MNTVTLLQDLGSELSTWISRYHNKPLLEITDDDIKAYFKNNIKSFQVVSRNNDTNGNPYRLVLLYVNENYIIGIQERSSMPNIKAYLRGNFELMGFHLSPSGYKSTIQACQYVRNL